MVLVMRLAGPDNLDRSEWQAELLSQRHGITPDKPLYDRLILVGTAAEQRGWSLRICKRMVSASCAQTPTAGRTRCCTSVSGCSCFTLLS